MIYFAFHQSIGIPLAAATVAPLGLSGTTGKFILNQLLIFLLVVFICFIFDLIIRHTPLRFMAGK
jgi:hypothetical protein